MEVKVYIRHVKAMRYCTKGIRYWCELHGLDFKRLIREGFTADELIETGDSMGIRVAEFAIEEAENGRK
jgi:hypothetical protein